MGSASQTVDSKHRTARAAAEMANRYYDVISSQSVRDGLDRSEQEEAALSSLAFAFARAIVETRKSDHAARHLLAVALVKNRAVQEIRVSPWSMTMQDHEWVRWAGPIVARVHRTPHGYYYEFGAPGPAGKIIVIGESASRMRAHVDDPKNPIDDEHRAPFPCMEACDAAMKEWHNAIGVGL